MKKIGVGLIGCGGRLRQVVDLTPMWRFVELDERCRLATTNPPMPIDGGLEVETRAHFNCWSTIKRELRLELRRWGGDGSRRYCLGTVAIQVADQSTNPKQER